MQAKEPWQELSEPRFPLNIREHCKVRYRDPCNYRVRYGFLVPEYRVLFRLLHKDRIDGDDRRIREEREFCGLKISQFEKNFYGVERHQQLAYEVVK